MTTEPLSDSEVLLTEWATDLIELIDECRAQGIDPIPILANELRNTDG